MSAEAVTRWGAARIAAEVGRGSVKAEAVAAAFLGRVKRLDPELRAFLRVHEDAALEAARAVDKDVAAGRPPGRLAGVPVAVKDNILVSGFEAGAGSRILEGYRAPYDATAAARLKAEGAVIIGRTNMDEFAMGSSTENSAFFPTRNPWARGRVPGGSSGGSAAAVAARLCGLALGSDTGGSIRQPASFCGVVGLKPTYGAVSRHGLVAFASSLDQIGVLARTVEDAALALAVISGRDPADSTCEPRGPVDCAAELERGVSGLRVGVPREYFGAGVDPEVARLAREAVSALEAAGARASEVSLPHTRFGVSAYYIIAPAEASSNLARFDGMRYGFSAARENAAACLLEVYERTRGRGFGAEVKRRVMLGTYALSSGYYEAYYGRAQKIRSLIRRDFAEAFAAVDLIAAPVAPTPPFLLGEKVADPLTMYLSDALTIPASLAGLPGLSVPAGLTGAGLPVGVQLLGRPFDEPVLLRAARTLEKSRPFPELAGENLGSEAPPSPQGASTRPEGGGA